MNEERLIELSDALAKYRGELVHEKRKKVIKAGPLVYTVITTPPMPKDPEHVRAAKSKATTQARKALNLKSAYQN